MKSQKGSSFGNVDAILDRRILSKIMKTRNGSPLYRSEKEVMLLNETGRKLKELFRKRS